MRSEMITLLPWEVEVQGGSVFWRATTKSAEKLLLEQ